MPKDDDDDDHEDDDRPSRRGGRVARRGFRCAFCGCGDPPRQMTRISTTGWIVFAILLLGCFPLCWIGLLIKEPYRVCQDCGTNLN